MSEEKLDMSLDQIHNTSNAPEERICHTCGGKGHIAKYCANNNRAIRGAFRGAVHGRFVQAQAQALPVYRGGRGGYGAPAFFFSRPGHLARDYKTRMPVYAAASRGRGSFAGGARGGRRGRDKSPVANGSNDGTTRERDSSPAEAPYIEPSNRVFVGNLPYHTSWQALKDHMRAAGNVLHVDMLQSPDGRNSGNAIVEFESDEQAALAIETLNNTLIEEREIYLRYDKEEKKNTSTRGVTGTGVYIGNLAFQSTWQDVKDLCLPFGECHADVKLDHITGRSKGYAIATFRKREDAEKAIAALNLSTVHGRQLVVRIDNFGSSH